MTTRFPQHRDQKIVAGSEGRQLAITYRYAPPTNTTDTLIVSRATLAPERETLRLSGRTMYLMYTPTSVDITIRRDTGVADHHVKPLAMPAFAFNEREAVVRSLPLREEYHTVLPLFSEIDEVIEMDTVSVIGHVRADDAASAWRVRFADPAIVVTYEIDVTTRNVLSESITQRKSGGRMRYVSTEHTK